MEPVTLFASIPAVLALVTVAKDLGLSNKLAPVVAVVLGIILSLLDGLAGGDMATTADVLGYVSTGLIVGLSASGVYDGAKIIGNKRTNQPNDE